MKIFKNSPSRVNQNSGLFSRNYYGLLSVVFLFNLLNWNCFNPDSVLSVSVSKVDASGLSIANGQAIIQVKGGSPPFVYQWSNGGGSDSLRFNLLPGFYNVVVVDAIGVIDSVSFEIGVLSGGNFNISVSKVDATNLGAANGQAFLSVSGGAPPYQYLWSNGGGSDSARSNLLPGFYTVVVEDQIGLKDSVSFEIGVSGGANILAIQVNSTNASAPYTADGSATAIVNGGVPPYTYAWSNGGTGPNIFNLLPGNYSLTVYDSQNNYDSKNFSVGVDSPFPIIQWVQIPAGTFTMGSPSYETDRASNEGPQHSVSLSGFKMSKYEVTFAQYDAFCDATGRTKPSDEGWGRGNRPVINVDWNDATAFAQWMGCRLPTEAEWEYACRAGTTSPFNTGSCLSSSEANYAGNYPYSTCAIGTYLGNSLPVGFYAPNAWGLYDMHGNVWEWCSDWYGGYSSGAQTNPEGPSSGSYRVLRGGSWFYHGRYCRSAGRNAIEPSHRSHGIGFRLVVPN